MSFFTAIDVLGVQMMALPISITVQLDTVIKIRPPFDFSTCFDVLFHFFIFGFWAHVFNMEIESRFRSAEQHMQYCSIHKSTGEWLLKSSTYVFYLF